MSFDKLINDLLDKINTNCLNFEKNGFCTWEKDDILPETSRDYCIYIFHFGYSAQQHLCKKCKKNLIKCNLAILNYKVKKLEKELQDIHNKLVTKNY